MCGEVGVSIFSVWTISPRAAWLYGSHKPTVSLNEMWGKEKMPSNDSLGERVLL
jgi:hypothetical protein